MNLVKQRIQLSLRQINMAAFCNHVLRDYYGNELYGQLDLYSIWCYPRLMPFRPLFPCVLWFADITWSIGTHNITLI